MKKKVALFLIGVMFGFMMGNCVGAQAGEAVNVLINGVPLYSDVPPQVIDGRVMVPIRFIAEALGATVTWDEASNTAYITSQSDGDTEFTNNTVPIEVPPAIDEAPGQITDSNQFNDSFMTAPISGYWKIAATSCAWNIEPGQGLHSDDGLGANLYLDESLFNPGPCYTIEGDYIQYDGYWDPRFGFSFIYSDGKENHHGLVSVKPDYLFVEAGMHSQGMVVSYDNGVLRHMKLDINGGRIDIYIDGQYMFTYIVEDFNDTNLHPGIWASSNSYCQNVTITRNN